MKFLWHRARPLRRWARRSVRRAMVAASALLLLGGALFSIGQLQANQNFPPVRPFHHDGNTTGVLLIHGFGGSPLQLQPLARRLAEEGFTVHTPLLPGHGTTPRDFGATDNEEYLTAVRREVAALRSRCGHVYAVGFSMGGLLALQLEGESKLDGLVLLSTPIQPWNDHADFDWLKFAAAGGARLGLFVPTLGIPAVYKAARRELGDSSLALVDPAYAAYPATSCLRLLELIEQVKPRLAAVRTPALIVQSRDDIVAAPSSAAYLFGHLGSPRKRLVYLERSGHLIALGPERERLAQEVIRFVRAGSPGSDDGR